MFFDIPQKKNRRHARIVIVIFIVCMLVFSIDLISLYSEISFGPWRRAFVSGRAFIMWLTIIERVIHWGQTAAQFDFSHARVLAC